MSIFKKILLFSPLIINYCSCTISEQPKILDKKIEILNNLTIPNLEFEQQYISEEINLKYENILEKNIQLKIINSQNSNEKVPDWIYINNENKVVIEKNNQPGKYFFAIYAYSDVDYVKSNDIQLSFAINQKNQFPETITVDLDHVSFFIDEEISFKLPIVCDHKNSDNASYDFNVMIKPIKSYKYVDLSGKDLFSVRKIDNDWFVECSPLIDKTYLDDYYIEIYFVSSDYKNYIWDDHSITVSIVDVLTYCDPKTDYIYHKFSKDGTWTLMQVKNNTSYIDDVAEMIDGSWVTKINDDICKTSNVDKLTVVFLPKSITEIGDYAFYDQQYLGYISMSNVNKIGKYAFYNCVILMFADDAAQICLESIGEYAFYMAKKIDLKNVQNLTTIPDYSFAYSGIVDLTIDVNCNYVGKAAFSMCMQLKRLQFNAMSPPTLLDDAFFGCNNLKIIYVPLLSIFLYLQNHQWVNIKQNLSGF